MFLSLNWLREYVELPETAEQVGEQLTLLGFEVESIRHTGISLPGVVIGKVLEVEKHPNADRLRVCKVDIGSGELQQIVCGAPNVAAGQTVAVATIGTELPVTLPDGKKLVIKESAIRGVASKGMICAEDELGIGADHSGIMILEDELRAGSRFDARFAADSDSIIEISITPNRPDVTNHYGAARELAAKYVRPLAPLVLEPGRSSAYHPEFRVVIEDAAACPRYQGILIRNVNVSPSPEWLKKRLENAGLRSINNVVDATNYVMLSVGQPLHAFDVDKLRGASISVKSFPHEVAFTTLDHTERAVPPGSLFICDAEGPVALAGIMGGLHSEVSDSTVNVLLESAFFNPVTIRKASRLLGLRSDASYRFERGIDPENTSSAGWICAKLIAEIAGGHVVEPAVDVVAAPYVRKQVASRLSKVNQILGTSFPLDYCVDILNRLKLPTTHDGVDGMFSEIPGFRPDLEREIDLIEEIARVHDYNAIEAPKQVGFKKPDPIPESIRFISVLKDALVRAGLHEIYTNSLHPDTVLEGLDEDVAVRPLNPITRDQAILRTALLPGMLRIAAYNENRGATGLDVFETGRVFRTALKGSYVDGIQENIQVGILLAGQKHPQSWRGAATSFDVFDVKALVDSVFQQLEIRDLIKVEVLGTQELAYTVKSHRIGTLHAVTPKLLKAYDITMPVFQAEFDAEALASLYLAKPVKKFVPVPRFPGIEYDLAFVVGVTVPASDILSIIKKRGGSSMQQVSVFDVFLGEVLGSDKKSLGFRINFLDHAKTLTLNDIQPIIDQIVKEAGERTGAVLRS
jgi:phenylalanyl-tRNA synthetase beta chain